MTLARFLRQRDAPNYLGMSEPKFNKLVRPDVNVIKEGRAIFYDRLDLDHWADIFKAANGSPGKPMEEKSWQNPPLASEKKATSGTSIKRSPEGNFEKALERRSFQKQKNF